MRGIGFAPLATASEAAGYPAPSCRPRGAARGSLVSFPGFALWAVRGRLGPGAVLAWRADHGDEALWLASGDLTVDGRACPAGGVVIVESGVPAEVTAPRGATVVHFGPHDPHPPADGLAAAERRGVHVIGARGMFAADEPGRDTRMFADSTCPTCRITLFATGRDHAYVSSRHSHSTDEILYVTRGEIRFGGTVLRPGDAAGIEADRRYGFRSGPGGFSLLNYRRDASALTVAGGVTRPEGGLAQGLTPVDDLR